MSCLFLTACIQARNQASTPGSYPSVYYKVQPHETLSQIAHQHGLSTVKLAKTNHISPPYSIYVGQILAIPSIQYAEGNPHTKHTKIAGKVHPLPPPSHLAAENLPSLEHGETIGKIYVPPKQLSLSASQDSSSSHKIARQLLNDANASAPPLTHNKKGPIGLLVNFEAVQKAGGNEWSWPMEGHLTQSFNQGQGLLGKGIQIAGSSGTPILAAASGQVLYSGIGAQGYGKMIIVKHSNNFLTAYSDLSSIDVKQGQKIARGTVLGIIGLINNTPMLHFEIRQFGNPVDPLQYLPEDPES